VIFRFVDIKKIVGHHTLHFLFIITSYIKSLNTNKNIEHT